MPSAPFSSNATFTQQGFRFTLNQKRGAFMPDKKKWPGFEPTDLLLPKDCDMNKWSVVACDQYTSQPEYWERVDAYIGEVPSARKMILAEAFLRDGKSFRRGETIHKNMEDYLSNDVFTCYPDALIYTERWLNNGSLRRGLVGAVDLEEYDYNGSAETLIRATEGTVLSRIPPRMMVRREAALELSHVMMLIDDPQRQLVEHLTSETDQMKQLYDFDLMEKGGHITGWLLTEEQKDEVREMLWAMTDRARFEALYDADLHDELMLYAVGDGNHSLATAKAVYQERKETVEDFDPETDPSRYAMVELMNLHDDSLQFEAIHRVCFDIEPEKLLRTLLDYYPGTHYGEGEGHTFRFVWEKGEGVITIPNPASQLPVASLQGFIDYYLALDEGMNGYVDYVHGEDITRELGTQPGNIGFLLDPMPKEKLFSGVVHDGALPRKTFSMGEANDKRFYLEARKIK